MAGTNDVLNNVRDFDSLRAAMPHSPRSSQIPADSHSAGPPLSFGPCRRCRARTSPRSLPKPSLPRNGAVLRTIGEAANYVLALPTERAEHCNRWRHAARLLLDQADVADVSRQIHLALFYDAQLDIGAMGT